MEKGFYYLIEEEIYNGNSIYHRNCGLHYGKIAPKKEIYTSSINHLIGCQTREACFEEFQTQLESGKIKSACFQVEKSGLQKKLFYHSQFGEKSRVYPKEFIFYSQIKRQEMCNPTAKQILENLRISELIEWIKDNKSLILQEKDEK